MLENIKLVPISKIHLHESHESARLKILSAKIIDDGYLKNPLLVTQMNNENYFVIDGVHRFNSLRLAGCAKVPVQVVNPGEMNLSTWAHEVPVGPWLEAMRMDPSLRWQTTLEENTEWLASIIDENGTKNWLVPLQPIKSLEQRLKYWHKIVNSYLNHVSIKRVALDTENLPDAQWVRFAYPVWTIQQIEMAVAFKSVLPPGTTRFIVKNKSENLNISLDLLINKSSLEISWNNLKKYWFDFISLAKEYRLPQLESELL